MKMVLKKTAEPKKLAEPSIIEEFNAGNVVTIKALRSFAGKAMNIATILFMWRPFLHQLWAAMTAPGSLHIDFGLSCLSELWQHMMPPSLMMN